MSEREAIHIDPIWNERADSTIAVSIDPGSTEIRFEQLRASRVDEWHFEVCCIPFFAYDLALGDIVEVDELGFVTRVSVPSGRYVFRVHFGRSAQPSAEVVQQIKARGGLVEWSSPIMLAVDAEDAGKGQEIADFLWEQEQKGYLMYETGKT